MEKIYRQILILKEKSLTEIAFEMAYKSSANFSRDFYNYYHFTPTKIRAMGKCHIARKTVSDSNLNLSFIKIENIPDRQIIYEGIFTGYNPEIISRAFMELCEYFQAKRLPFSIGQMI